MDFTNIVMNRFTHTVKSIPLNTGTTLDLATGCFVPGKNGSMILNGGVFQFMGVSGRPQMYKSSEMLGYAGRILRNYRAVGAWGLIDDTEITLPGPERIVEISGDRDDHALLDQFQFCDKTNLSIEDLFEAIKNIAKEKEKNKKDLIRETPFLDKEGNFIKSWVPTIIAIDSFSAASSSKEATLYDDFTVGDSKTNMNNMNDGKIKTDFCKQIPQICMPKGIYLLTTAHIGNNYNLGNPNIPPPKDLPSMRASDKMKNVGSQYAFITPNLIEARKVELLQVEKKCEYPSDEYVSDFELSKITNCVTRCKNNVSGATFDHISSQYNGLQEHLEFYLLIRNCKNSNILEGTVNQNLGIHDQVFTKKTIRRCIKLDYTFRRALEILGHFVFVRNRWNLPHVNAMGYADFCKKFNASKTLKERILNSTGIWNFNEVIAEREYLSILDIIELINKEGK